MESDDPVVWAIFIGMLALVLLMIVSFAYDAGKGDLGCRGNEAETPCDEGRPYEQIYDEGP